MMEVNAVVPNVVLHFHGFRVSMLSNVEAALCHLALDLLRKMAVATAASSACLVATQAARLAAPALADGLVSSLITFATFSSCTVLAHGPAQLLHKPLAPDYSTAVDLSAAKAAAASAPSPATLPLLAAKRLAPIASTQSPTASSPKLSPPSAKLAGPSALPAARRRVLSHLRQPPPGVNPVAGETRRRAHMSLERARLRVGKAHTQLRADASGRAQDVYMVRVDCSEPGASEKHMNPVVMWDVTATFGEFQQLEQALKREVRGKKLRAKVPHLSSGAVLFVQEELTPHVLNARRARLQAFLDAVQADAELAASDSLRKFCQAY